MEKFLDKFKMGKHYKMERFTVTFFVLLSLMLLVTGFAFKSSVSQRDQAFIDNAVYSTEFTTSKTNVNGTVQGVFRNDDFTKSFVLLKFDDIQKVSNKAEDYQMFLTGAEAEGNPTKLIDKPSGSIYTFGNSGYMGIYLVNQNGFKPQVLDLTIRGNAQLVHSNNMSNKEIEDGSFAKHDQLKIFFNPGGKDGEVIESLNKKDAPTILDIYYDTVINRVPDNITARDSAYINYEPGVRHFLDTKLDEMNQNLSNIDAYANRLRTASTPLEVPKLPEFLRGDKMESFEITEGEGEEEVSSVKYKYKPATVLSKGIQFEWRDGSIYEGYSEDLMKDSNYKGEDIIEFLAELRDKEDRNESFSKSDIQWVISINGEPLDTLSNEAEKAEIMKEVDDYLNSVDNYYKNKREYQTDLLPRLIRLEVEMHRVTNNTTINANKDVLQYY